MPYVLGEYLYLNDAGCITNRRIIFQRKTAQDSRSIHAVLYARVNREWIKIHKLKGKNITITFLTKSEIIDRIQKERCDGKQYGRLSTKLSELGDMEQIKIITELIKRNKWGVSITRDIGKNPRFEALSSMHFHPIEEHSKKINLLANKLSCINVFYHLLHPSQKFLFQRRDPNNPKTIYVSVYSYNNEWGKVAEIDGQSILIETERTSEVIRKLRDPNIEYTPPADKPLCEFDDNEQIQIIKELLPEGGWDVSSIINGKCHMYNIN